MANGVLQGAGFVFGIIGAVFMAAAILLPYWSQTDPSDEFLVIPTHQGLRNIIFILTKMRSLHKSINF